MSSENQFFNFHLRKDCSNNSKVGFQSLNSDVQALQKALTKCRDWAKGGTLKDGDVLVIYARYTETDAAEDLHIDELQMADGTTRAVPEAVPGSAEEDEIPF